jgi:hypothetical protein
LQTLNWVLLLMLITLLSHLLFFAAPFLTDHFASVESMSYWLHQLNMAMLGYLLLVFGLLQPIIFEPDLSYHASKVAEIQNEKHYLAGTGL